MISALASRAPVESMWEVRDVFLFAAAPVTYLAYQHPRMRRLAVRIFGIGIVAAVLIGLAGTISAVDAGVPDYRPDGTLGHYMTYAGVLMLAIPLLLTVGGRRGWLWHRAIVIGALLMIGLTMTRSAWIGCIAGLACWVVTRFVKGPKGALVSIEDHLTSTSYDVEEGQRFGGFKLARVDAAGGSATIERGGKTYTIYP